MVRLMGSRAEPAAALAAPSGTSLPGCRIILPRPVAASARLLSPPIRHLNRRSNSEIPAQRERPHRMMRPFHVTKLSYTLNEDPQPQVLFTFGFSNLNPAPSSVST